KARARPRTVCRPSRGRGVHLSREHERWSGLGPHGSAEPRMRHCRKARLEYTAHGPGLQEDGEVTRVVVEDDRVEDVARRDLLAPVGDSAQLRRAGGRNEQCLLGRKPGLAHESELLEILAVLFALDVVRAGCERDAVLLGDADAFADVEPEVEDLRALPRRERSLAGPAEAVAHGRESRDEEAPRLSHLRRLLLGEKAAVLDR